FQVLSELHLALAEHRMPKSKREANNEREKAWCISNLCTAVLCSQYMCTPYNTTEHNTTQQRRLLFDKLEQQKAPRRPHWKRAFVLSPTQQQQQQQKIEE